PHIKNMQKTCKKRENMRKHAKTLSKKNEFYGAKLPKKPETSSTAHTKFDKNTVFFGTKKPKTKKPKNLGLPKNQKTKNQKTKKKKNINKKKIKYKKKKKKNKKNFFL